MHGVTPALPETFGPYLLLQHIGEGGMAQVFQAAVRDSDGQARELVVKRIRAELSASPELVRMFADEARITALLHHPNIVHVMDFGQVDGIQFLAMEYLDGRDLASVQRALRPAGLSLRAPLVAQIGLEVARGLHHAHTLCDRFGRPCLIVHRDINPANIMLLRAGGVKILDFGIAKASELVGKAQTSIAKVKGKLGYLSPEQARGEPLDGRSDLFSLGITLWELLTGQRLFAGSSNFERIRNVLGAPIPAPSSLRRSVPPALDRIVLRALERERSRRYQSAGHVASDLAAFLRANPLRADAIKLLLERLPGAGPPAGAARLSDSGGASGPVPAGVTQGILSGPVAVGAASPGGRARLRQPALRWAAGAAVLVAALGAVLGVLRSGSAVRPPPLPVAPVVEPLRGPEVEPVTVRVEVQSQPDGAAVYREGHRLGVTPLVLTLPRSLQMEHIQLRAVGFLARGYDFRPDNDALALVELERAGVHAARPLSARGAQVRRPGAGARGAKKAARGRPAVSKRP
jgi:serine/threonine-protein kinase